MALQKDIDNRIPIIVALLLATLMNTIDTTIAVVALPHMQGSLSASQDQITWVLTSYIVGTAVMTPLSGWLSLRIGRKRMFLFSIAGFTIASVLCGVASSLPEMVLYRLLQGLAGASVLPLSQTVVLDIFPPHLMQRVMSLWGAAFVLGPIIGPTLGGWLTETFSWRWVFYINLPIGIIGFVILWTFMGDDRGGRERPFDFVGFGALTVFVLGLQLMVDRGPRNDWFESHETWMEAALAAAGLWAFTIQTATAEHPFFHRDLIKDTNFVATTVLMVFVGVLITSSTALLPSFMQNLLGYSALQSGIASMPRGFGSLVGFLSAPVLITRMGQRTVMLIGIVVTSLAMWEMGQFDLSMTATPIELVGLLQGLGSSLVFAPLTALAFATLSPVHRTEGAIVSTMTRSLGGSVGISIVQAVLTRDSAVTHSGLTEHITTTDPVMRWSLPAMFDLHSSTGLMALNGEVTRQAAMIGYDAVFAGMAVASLLLAPPLLFMKPVPRVSSRDELELVAE